MSDEYTDDAFVNPPWLQGASSAPASAATQPPQPPMVPLPKQESPVTPSKSQEEEKPQAVAPVQQQESTPAADETPKEVSAPAPGQVPPPPAVPPAMVPQGPPPQGMPPQGPPFQQPPMQPGPMPQPQQMPNGYGIPAPGVPMQGMPPQNVIHPMHQQHGPGPQYPGGLQAPQERKLAQQGWRKAINAASGGLIRLGESKGQQEVNALVGRVRAPISGQFNLAVLSLKGGVGKTTTTIGIGSAFASLRGDRVIAVDANPDLGTLASRVPRQTASTVRTLLHAQRTETYSDVRMHTSQAVSRLEVLASERDPVISESFSEDEYRKVIAILERHYNIILTDCGTGLMHSAMGGVLDIADSLIIISSPAVDGAESATATLDWLSLHGYENLVRQAVVVISASKPGSALIDLDMLTQHFLGRVRAVQIIPYDEHLAVGSHVDLDSLHRKTRTAFLELAATVADSFGQPAGAWGPMGPPMMPQSGYGMPVVPEQQMPPGPPAGAE
ncbi:hypothetical protein GOARA_033_00100 [Gordonia araii NBRC 100433]|uniref:AAA domain-containing protein n=1 Tax=Gordonia araii NBRC 100433 TaxID=1073574 RepID=G7H034_9ACTN|nr:MinD/ParA family protein [Gordonia araii]GAB09209.1 hypothetical protein GOARA_033_00100 [Gordonia araii NBRC 100433]